ncbi:MAG TPA: hypothetical protein VGP46_07960, partial [Acidimicrobiales bacterium]|nr:hypothetical protein [Acidimicrobiales bacterium]
VFDRIHPMFEQRSFIVLNIVRLVTCLAIPVLLADPMMSVALLLIVACVSILISFRNFFGTDGSDQMIVIVYVSLLVYASSANALVRDSAVAFLGGQCILSYVSAGIAKAVSPVWRDGLALRRIFSTETYGVAVVRKTLSLLPQSVNVALCWTVILVESLFFLVVFAPWQVCLIFLAWGLVFHLVNAVAMGLNTCFWAFPAAYPAVLLLNHWLAIKP